MRINEIYGNCSAVIGSMTQAIRAQRVLADAAIRAEVVKADASVTRYGCAYAVSYPCSQDRNVREVLRNARIRVHFFYGGSGR